MRSDKTLKEWYREINTKFFLNELADDTCVRWADEDETDECGQAFGWTDIGDERHRFQIVLNREHNRLLTVRLQTLAHEMCHIATELRDNHGEAFDRWHKLLTERGLFKKGALRRGLTLF